MQDVVFHLARAVQWRTPEFPGKWRLRKLISDRAVRARIPSHPTVTTGDGVCLSLTTDDFIEREIYLFGHWEENVAAILRTVLRSGDVFIDIGSNIGAHALLAARLVGPTGRVLAFEPNDRIRARLLRNVALNGFTQIEVIGHALSDTAGAVPLYPGEHHNSGASSLRPRPGSGAPQQVLTRPLDAVLEEHPALGRIALVKVDVEGAELNVLRGMSGLLSRAQDGPAVLCEISDWGLRQFGHSADELCAFMSSHGYEHRAISPVRQSVFADGDEARQYDALFVKAGASAAPPG